jgi:hypothetical protein
VVAAIAFDKDWKRYKGVVKRVKTQMRTFSLVHFHTFKSTQNEIYLHSDLIGGNAVVVAPRFGGNGLEKPVTSFG